MVESTDHKGEEVARGAVALPLAVGDFGDKLAFLLELSNDGVVVLDDGGHVVAANEQASVLFRAKSPLVGRLFRALRLSSPIRPLPYETRPDCLIYRAGFCADDQTPLQVEVSFSPVFAEGQRFYVGLLRDVTGREAEAQRLQRLTDLYAALSETWDLVSRRPNEDVLYSGGCQALVEAGRLRMASVVIPESGVRSLRTVCAYGVDSEHLAAFELPLDPAHPRGQSVTAQAFRTGHPQVVNNLDERIDLGPWYVLTSSLGISSMVSFPIVRRGHVAAVLSVYSDERHYFDQELTDLIQRVVNGISFAVDALADEAQRKEAEARLTYLATHDGLTGLKRRMTVEDLLDDVHQQAYAASATYSVALMDLDHFKVINDNYGHAAGDRVLVHVAKVLGRALGENRIFGRWGGEEFLCVLPGADERTALREMHHLCADLSGEPVLGNSMHIKITASIGVASYPAHGGRPSDLLARADEALYRGKQSGGDCVVTASMAPGVFMIGGIIEDALSGARLVPAYQPIIDLASGRVVADEALARIRIEGDGPEGVHHLDAGSFIDAALHLRLLSRIDQAIITCALDRAHVRSAEVGSRLHFVNVSGELLARPDLLSGLLAQFEARGFAGPDNPFVLEITERALLADRRAALRVLSPLLEAGFRLALDDFGSGYSSFLYLLDLPVSFLKIEGQLAGRVAADKRSAIMVRSIASLAQDMGVITVAEGVEDSDTASELRELRVHWGQGFHFGRPLIEAPCEKTALARAL